MVKNARKNIFFVWASWARNGSFEVFFEKKELCPLRVRPWICVFLIFYFFLFYLFIWIKKQWMCSPFWFFDIWFLLFLWTYTVFLVFINIWKIFVPCFATQVGLQFGTICPNIRTNINVNFHTPRDHFISYNSM